VPLAGHFLFKALAIGLPTRGTYDVTLAEHVSLRALAFGLPIRDYVFLAEHVA
jgi:hypothetical protein